MASSGSPPEPIISAELSRPAPVEKWRKIDWPRRIPQIIFDERAGHAVVPQQWLLRELRRTAMHEAAQAIIDDDKLRR